MRVYGFSGPPGLSNYRTAHATGQTLTELITAAATAAITNVQPTTASAPAASFVISGGWQPTRASGILSILLAVNNLTMVDINDYYSANGLPGHTPSLDQNDSALVANDGNMSLRENWTWPTNWPDLWAQWSSGVTIAALPSTGAAVATTAITTTAQSTGMLGDLAKLLPFLVLFWNK